MIALLIVFQTLTRICYSASAVRQLPNDILRLTLQHFVFSDSTTLDCMNVALTSHQCNDIMNEEELLVAIYRKRFPRITNDNGALLLDTLHRFPTNKQHSLLDALIDVDSEQSALLRAAIFRNNTPIFAHLQTHLPISTRTDLITLASHLGHTHFITRLYINGMDLTSAFNAAIESDSIGTFRFLLSLSPILPFQYLHTHALRKVAEFNRPRFVPYLMRRGVSVYGNQQDVLQVAVKHNAIDVMKVLLQKGCDGTVLISSEELDKAMMKRLDVVILFVRWVPKRAVRPNVYLKWLKTAIALKWVVLLEEVSRKATVWQVALYDSVLDNAVNANDEELMRMVVGTLKPTYIKALELKEKAKRKRMDHVVKFFENEYLRLKHEEFMETERLARSSSYLTSGLPRLP